MLNLCDVARVAPAAVEKLLGRPDGQRRVGCDLLDQRPSFSWRPTGSTSWPEIPGQAPLLDTRPICLDLYAIGKNRYLVSPGNFRHLIGWPR